jgi:anaerobic selenocysteine-containing dehydrogenase
LARSNAPPHQPVAEGWREGDRHFAEISWDEAVAEIASRFRELIDAGEAAKILHTHYTGTT